MPIERDSLTKSKSRQSSMTWNSGVEASPCLQVCRRSSRSETRPPLWQGARWREGLPAMARPAAP